jgi:hypothetical protein
MRKTPSVADEQVGSAKLNGEGEARMSRARMLVCRRTNTCSRRSNFCATVARFIG